MLIDTHCHLSFKAFSDTWKEVADRAFERGVLMICVSSQKDTSKKSIKIAQSHEGVFSAIGFHPTHSQDEDFDFEWFSKNAKEQKVVAIGECGVDFYHNEGFDAKDILFKQEDVLRRQIEIAREASLPIILHARDSKEKSDFSSYDELLRIIKEEDSKRCVLHCFGGTWEQAKKFLDLGCLVSFTGIATFKNASNDLIETIKKVPKEMYMIETDAPYLSPEPHRGEVNEPAFVEHVARAIALIRGEEYDDIAETTTSNAKKFFNI